MALTVGQLAVLLDLDDKPFRKGMERVEKRFGGLTKAGQTAKLAIDSGSFDSGLNKADGKLGRLAGVGHKAKLALESGSFNSGVDKAGSKLAGLSGVAKKTGAAIGDGLKVGASAGLRGLSEVGRKAGAAVGSGMKVGAAAALVAVTKGFADALNIEAANDKLAAQLGATGDFAADLGKIAGDLYAGAYGESLAQVNEALKGVMQNGVLPEDATNAQIESVTAKVLDLATAFEQDLGGSTAAVGQMLRTGLAKDADEALDILTRGFQQGADKSGDLLDSFTEYSTMFRDLGISAAEATGLMSQGLQAGARDADTVGDALKEFAIRGQDASEAAAEGYQALGLSAQDMTAKVAGGGKGASEALSTVLDRLRGVEDPVKRNAAAVALFGTKAEDLGDSLFALDPSSAVAALGNVEGAAARMGSELNDNAKTKIESFKRRGLQMLSDFVVGTVIPALEGLGPVASQAFQGLADWWAENGPQIIATAQSVADGLRAGFQAVADWWASNGQQIIGGIQAVADAIGSWISDVAPAIRSWVTDVLGSLGDWWATWGPRIVETAQTIGTALLTMAEGAMRAAQWIVENWDRISPILTAVAGVIVAVLIPHWVALGIASVTSSALQVTSWVATQVASAKAALVHSVQVARIVAGWVASGAAAIASGAQTVAVWAMYQAEAVKAAAAHVAQTARIIGAWVASGVAAGVNAAKVVAGWVATAAAAVANAAVGVAQIGVMVARWVFLGAQSLLAAAKVAAAWLISMGPIALVIAAVAGVVALIVIHFDTIKRIIGTAWEWVKEKTASLWNGIRQLLVTVWEAIKAAVKFYIDTYIAIFSTAWETIKTGVRIAWDAIKAVITGVWQGIKAAIQLYIDTIKSIISLAWQTVTSGARIAWDGIKATITGTWDGIKSAVKGAVDSVASTLSGAWNGIKSAAESVWSAVGSAMRSGINIGIDAINFLIRALNTVADVLPGVDFNIGQIAKLAAGGPVTAAGRREAAAVSNRRAYAGGGTVGGVGEGDSVPALLTPGEFVIRKAAVRRIGVEALNRINRSIGPARDGSAGRYAFGGIIPGPGEVLDGLRGAAGKLREGMAMAAFAGPSKIADGMIDRIPWDMVRGAVRGIKDAAYNWVKGTDDTANSVRAEDVAKKVAAETAIRTTTTSGLAPSATGINPDFLGRFRAWTAATGNKYGIGEGFRTFARQLYHWNRYLSGEGNLAARPGTSQHEKGLAIDTSPRASAADQALAAQFRLHFPVRGEPWHIEPFAAGGLVAQQMAAVAARSNRGRYTITPPSHSLAFAGTPIQAALANGGVITRPTVALMGERAASRPEIVTPEDLMRRIVREETGNSGPAVLFAGDNHFHDELDLEAVDRKLDFAVSAWGR